MSHGPSPHERFCQFEVATRGFDPAFATIGSDAWAAHTASWLTIPAVLPPGTVNAGDPPDPRLQRYTLLLAIARFQASRCVRLIGIRQRVDLRAVLGVTDSDDPCGVEVFQEIEDGFWHPPDGNISWHVLRVPLGDPRTSHPGNREGEQFRWGETPALLFERPTTDPMGYLPPFGGQPGPGLNALAGAEEFYNFHDLRFGNRDAHTAYEMSEWFRGPCDIALVASVRQTVPGRCEIPPLAPGTVLGVEDQFMSQYRPDALNVLVPAHYGRIFGALVFEEVCRECFHCPRGRRPCAICRHEEESEPAPRRRRPAALAPIAPRPPKSKMRMPLPTRR